MTESSRLITRPSGGAQEERQRILALWDTWRKDLKNGAFTHGDGLRFVQMVEGGDAAPLLVAARWQPIATAPEGAMLLFCSMTVTEARFWCWVDWLADGRPVMFPPRMATHWMPLPNPPNQNQAEPVRELDAAYARIADLETRLGIPDRILKAAAESAPLAAEAELIARLELYANCYRVHERFVSESGIHQPSQQELEGTADVLEQAAATLRGREAATRGREEPR